MTRLLDKQQLATGNVRDPMTVTSGRSARWTAADIGDQRGRTVVVIGPNTGIGLEMAAALAEDGAGGRAGLPQGQPRSARLEPASALAGAAYHRIRDRHFAHVSNVPRPGRTRIRCLARSE